MKQQKLTNLSQKKKKAFNFLMYWIAFIFTLESLESFKNTSSRLLQQ